MIYWNATYGSVNPVHSAHVANAPTSGNFRPVNFSARRKSSTRCLAKSKPLHVTNRPHIGQRLASIASAYSHCGPLCALLALSLLALFFRRSNSRSIITSLALIHSMAINVDFPSAATVSAWSATASRNATSSSVTILSNISISFVLDF